MNVQATGHLKTRGAVQLLQGALLGLFLVLGGCSSEEADPMLTVFVDAPTSTGEPLILDGATIVDTRTGTLLHGLSIQLRDGLIDVIAPADELTVTSNVIRVDVSGKFIVPGYMDMHAHPLGLEDPKSALALMLVNGITGYRQMSGGPELLATRAGNKEMPAESPELLAMPGSVLVPQIASSPAKVVEEVRQQKADGADFIKAVAMQRDAYLAAMDEAANQGLPFVGHLPANIDVRLAITHGMKAIEHLGPGSSLFLSCSSEEALLREELAQSPPSLPPVLPEFLAKLLSPITDRVIKRILANPILAEDEYAFTLMQRMVHTYDEKKCKKLAADIAASDLWQVPTLIRLRAMEFGAADTYRKNPNLTYMPEKTRQLWNSVLEDFEADITDSQRATLESFYSLQSSLVKTFDQAGVKMLAGSDLGGQWLIPGFSLHQEFDLLEEAGILPIKILQMSTLNAATFLGREDTLGTVEVGRSANLVILSKDPLISAKNLHKIEAVIRNGHYFSAEDLERLKRQYNAG